ncbi:MAG: type VI secretion system baseplate subunit TssK [Pirellulales bacterium]
MRNLPVHWSEGMFLRPHHFQAADRYWAETLQTSEQWDHQFNYGLRRLEISQEALANSQFQVSMCQARLRDGTLVALGHGEELDRVDLGPAIEQMNAALGNLQIDLKEGFEGEQVIKVYLAVPKLKMGAVNVAPGRDGQLHRFSEVKQSLQDESQGGNDQELGLKSMSVRLLLSTQDLAGYEVLPIAAIQRAGDREATPRLDARYIPPLLAVDAWPGLSRGIVRAIYDIVGNKIKVLSQQVLSRGVTLVSQEPGDLDRLLMLSQLNESYAVLSVLSFAPGVHPFIAYGELVRLVGKLSIFGSERAAPEIPRYDHDDLAGIFYWVKQQIELLLGSVRDYEYEQRFFVGQGLGMQVALDAKWLNADWQWYVGVARGNISEKECQDLLSAGQLDWKLGSARQVQILFENRAEGLLLVPLARAPRALPATGDWVFYEVSRQNAAWKDVHETQTLAMRVKDSLIVNRDSLQGQRKLILNYRGKQAAVQFALFAVPTRQ